MPEVSPEPAAEGAPPADDVETDDDVIVEEMLAALHNTQARQLLDHSMSAPEILAGLVAADPVAFARHVLPVIREAATASRTGRILDDCEQDEAFGFRPPQPAEHDPALLGRVAQAVRAAAGAGDSFTHTAITEMSSSPLAAEQALAAAGFASGHPDLLDSAVSWLVTGPYAFAQGWAEDPRALSAEVLAIACAQLPAERTRDVQQKAAFYTHDFERKYRELYGSAAQRLLRDIPADRLTPQAKARKDELNREFPPKPTGPSWEKLGGAIDLSVQSPIPDSSVK